MSTTLIIKERLSTEDIKRLGKTFDLALANKEFREHLLVDVAAAVDHFRHSLGFESSQLPKSAFDALASLTDEELAAVASIKEKMKDYTSPAEAIGIAIF